MTSRDRRLATLTSVLALDPIPIDQAVAETWARLRVSLREFGLRMPVNDSWIAATAMTLGIPVVTQDDTYLHAPASRSSTSEADAAQRQASGAS